MSVELKAYRVKLRNGVETTLMLSADTVARDYPDAVLADGDRRAVRKHAKRAATVEEKAGQ